MIKNKYKKKSIKKHSIYSKSKLHHKTKKQSNRQKELFGNRIPNYDVYIININYIFHKAKKPELIYNIKDYKINDVIFINEDEFNDINKNNYFNIIKDKYISLFDNLHKHETNYLLIHIISWHKILKSNKKFGIVLDNDNKLNKNFNNILSNYIKQIPTNFDIVYINQGNKTELEIKNFSTKITTNLYKTNIIDCTGRRAYLISKKCCELLLNHFNMLINNNITIKFNLKQEDFMKTIFNNLKLDIYYVLPEITTISIF